MPHSLIRQAALCIVLGSGSLAAQAAVPDTARGHLLDDTGIDFCIDGNGQFIGCKGTGQDAATGRDVTQSRDDDGTLGFRFTRICNSGEHAGHGSCPALPPTGDGADEWGCTRDEVTRLLWETKTESGLRAGSNHYTYYTKHYNPAGELGGPNDVTGFLNNVNAAGLCGLNDWRLPTPNELAGIADMGLVNVPAIDLRFMPNTLADVYWAAGTVHHTFFAKELAWSTDFAFGLGDMTAQFREMPRPVRLVHGSAGGGRRFVAVAGGTEIEDRQTGLTWRRCVEGETFASGSCTGTPLALDWLPTLEHARQEARDTGVKWRLPNVKELGSLLDHEDAIHIDIGAFPGAQNDMLWTSSSFPTDPTPRCVDFIDGITFGCSQGGGGGGGGPGSRLVRDSN